MLLALKIFGILLLVANVLAIACALFLLGRAALEDTETEASLAVDDVETS